METLKIDNNLYKELEKNINSELDSDIRFALNIIQLGDEYDKETQINIPKLYGALTKKHGYKYHHLIFDSLFARATNMK
jgi:predicted unusual protein kinase regulating ubiquinone biosynthesis (AarF/ABC1/UbiB family)